MDSFAKEPFDNNVPAYRISSDDDIHLSRNIFRVLIYEDAGVRCTFAFVPILFVHTDLKSSSVVLKLRSAYVVLVIRWKLTEHCFDISEIFLATLPALITSH